MLQTNGILVLFYFISDFRISAINAARNAKIVLMQHLFYFIAHVRTALWRPSNKI